MTTQNTQNLDSIEELAQTWLKYMEYKGRAKSTIQMYGYDMRHFCGYLKEINIKKIGKLKGAELQRFFTSRTCKPISVARYYQTVKGFLQYCSRKKLVDPDLLVEVEAPTFKAKKINVPSMEEIEKLMAQPDVSSNAGLRDRAMMELIYSSGLRVTEICELKYEHLRNQTVHILHGKRGKTRTVPINATAWHWINEYIETLRGRNNGLLFVTKLAQQMDRGYVNKAIQRYVRLAGLSNITTHTFRHACATHFLEQGADIRMIQEILGHESLNTTQKYTHYSGTSLKESFNKFSPRKERDVELTPYI